MDKCECMLCQPTIGGRAHPEYGYDLDAVKFVECLHCNQPIGDAPYKEVPMLARFGSMMFVHQRCEEKNGL